MGGVSQDDDVAFGHEAIPRRAHEPHKAIIYVDGEMRTFDQGRDPTVRAVVLVEGVSDQLALEALAVRRERRLDDEGVSIVPMGGATNIARFLERYGPDGFDVKLAGLCDAGEEDTFRRALERAGLGTNLSGVGMERLGFFVCLADLEEELIRCLGVAAVEEVIAVQGDPRPWT